MGYGETCKGYRLVDPQNPGKAIYSRDVHFLEDEFIGVEMTGLKNEDILFFDQLNYLLNDNVGNNNDNNLFNDHDNIIKDDNDNNNNESNQDLSASTSDADLTPPAWSPLSDLYKTTEDFVDSDGDEDDDPVGAVSSMPVTSLRGGDKTASVGTDASVVTSLLRPVRSTRGNVPEKYKDFEMSSLMATGSSPDDPATYQDAISSSEKDEWCEAMKGEFDSMIKNNVWRLVDRPKHENVVKNKWVFKKKFDESGRFIKYKARLVACGYSQRLGVDYEDTFSPVVRHSTLRILFSIATQLDLCMDHIDVTTAFLNGELNEQIFMEQPLGFNLDKSKVCLLNKSLYGLKQSSRMWNIKIHDVLTHSGFTQSKCEPCVYVKSTKNEFVILALYVDDFYVFHNGCIEKVLSLLKQHFEIRHMGKLTNCLGMRVTSKKGMTVLDQSEYIRRLLAKFKMSDCKSVSTPLPVNCKLEKCESNCLNDNVYQYRQLLGSLMYLSVCTRPDISYACSQLGQFSTCFNIDHWRAAKRILRYLAGTVDYGIYFHKGHNFNICAYADADWANDLCDRKSHTGFVVKMGCNVVNWESRKQRCTALSGTKAEYLAIGDVCKDICFVRNFMSEIICKTLDVVIYNDNQSAQKLLLVKEYSHKRTKHIDVRYHFIKDLVQKGLINVKYLQTEKMVADVLTKPLSSMKHNYCISGLNLNSVK